MHSMVCIVSIGMCQCCTNYTMMCINELYMTGALDESIVTIQTIATSPAVGAHTTTMGSSSPIPRHGTYVIHHLMVCTYVRMFFTTKRHCYKFKCTFEIALH